MILVKLEKINQFRLTLSNTKMKYSVSLKARPLRKVAWSSQFDTFGGKSIR